MNVARKNQKLKKIAVSCVLLALLWLGFMKYVHYENKRVAIKNTLNVMEVIKESIIVYREVEGMDPEHIRSLQPQYLSILETANGLPIDRWHTEIIYQQATKTLVSAGLDKKFGTDDDLIIPIASP